MSGVIPELAEGKYAIVISDSHSSGEYIDFARQVAEHINSKGKGRVTTVIHLGDMGNRHLFDMRAGRKYFFERFKDDYDILVVKGNHDHERKLRGIIKNIKKNHQKKYKAEYPRELRLIDDEMIEYNGLKLIGMGLWHLQRTKEFTNYNEKLGKLLEKCKNDKQETILLSHYGKFGKGKGVKKWLDEQLGKGHMELMEKYNPINVYGHYHPELPSSEKISEIIMYLGIKPLDYSKEEKIVGLIDPQKGRTFNAARKVLILPLNPEKYAKA